jgi:hypothetical protein
LWRRLRKPDLAPAIRAGRKITYNVLSHGSKILAAARPFGPAEKIILGSSENESGKTNSRQNTKPDFSLKSN